MGIKENIISNFNQGYWGKAMAIQGLPKEFPAWTIKNPDWFGVAVPMINYKVFSEQFSQVSISSEYNVQIGEISSSFLVLKSYDTETRNEFSAICEHFVDPGENGQSRAELIDHPENWWKKWQGLIGNVSSNKEPYDVLGELLMYELLLKQKKKPSWTGIDYTVHDFVTSEFDVEVKSTTKRYGYEVAVSSIYQLAENDGRPLYLAFIRFEKTNQGESINSVIKRLIKLGCYETLLEKALESLGLEKGKTARDNKYDVIEWKKYAVDDSFPSITEQSFKNNTLPPNVLRFTYTVDLSHLSGENLKE